MKRLIILITVLFAVICGAQTFLNRNFMELKTAEKKWGITSFNAEKFKKGDKGVRASMAVDLVRSKTFVGKSFLDVKKYLGPHDGYFESDSIPAYLIEVKKKPNKEAWQILFLPDKTGDHVEDVKIHKNCCDAY